jgi:membrane protein required for colicin V production
MYLIDVIILIILIFAIVRGFINGLIKEVASLAALILGIWGAIKFSSFTAAKLYDYFDMAGHYVGIIAFIITFLIIVVLIHFVGILVDKLVTAVSLSFVNRILGIVFGLLKALLIMSVVFVILNTIDSQNHFLPGKQIERSKFYRPVSKIAPAIFPIIGDMVFKREDDGVKKEPEGVSI